MKENEKEIIIRIVTPDDAQELLDIYTPYVLHTAITFEYQPPTVEEFAQRIRKTLTRFPYLAAVQKQDGKILGYAYAAHFTIGKPMTGRSRLRFTCIRTAKERVLGGNCIRLWKTYCGNRAS